jgi:hypothetical protein
MLHDSGCFIAYIIRISGSQAFRLLKKSIINFDS